MSDASILAQDANPAQAAKPGGNAEPALRLAAKGWHVFPCREKPGEPYYSKKDEAWKTPDVKTPYTTNGKDDATTDPKRIRGWWKRWPDALIGIYCERSGLFALDIDNKDGRDGSRTFQELIETHGRGEPFEVGPVQDTPSGGQHLLFKLPAGVKIPNNADKLGPGLDLRSNGYICTGGPYAWLPGHGPDEPLTNAPAWLVDLIRNLTRPAERTASSSPAAEFAGDAAGHWLDKALDLAAVGTRNDTGFWLACQLRDNGVGESDAKATMAEYARSVPGEGYTEAEALASLREAYKSPARNPARRVGAAINGNGYHREPVSPDDESIFAGVDLDALPPPDEPPEDLDALPMAEPDQAPEIDEKILHTDMGNARRFAMMHAGRLRYVRRGWGWTVWTGKRWEQDETGRAMAMAKRTAKAIYREAERAQLTAAATIRAVEQAQERGDEGATKAAMDAKKAAEARANSLIGWAIKSQSRPRLESILSLAEDEPEIAARAAEFDRDPWALNVQNGILDLKTGEMQEHTPGAMITRIAGAAYYPGATCPRFERFLSQVFKGDAELIAFIRRAVGYSLTGNTGSQVMFFLYGIGANGKSTFTGVMQALLGDYASKTPTDSLMVKYSDGGIPNDLARLAGARAVIAAELAEGKRLNESLVKDLTGGDPITARYLRQEFFEFTPVFKLWMYGNHKPVIRGTDEGIWRRIKLIPFEVTIPEADRDPDLLDKLRAELPGILAWAVRGCMEWQEQGLKPPAAVDAATAAYRAEQDTLAQFLAESCVTGPGCTVTAGALHNAYQTWGGELKQRKFSEALRERGYMTTGRDGAGRAVIPGLGLLDPDMGRPRGENV